MTLDSDLAEKKKITRKIISLLRKEYPEAHCALNHSNAFELLLATILSAQCTDERVNIVTADLFRKYKTPDDYLAAGAAQIEKEIHSTGFFRNKTKSILGTSQMLKDEFGGKVPDNLDDLLRLPGVARKTANVVLGNAFGITSGIVVDTHVSRLANRLGLTNEKDPVKIENDLQALVPKKDWIDFSHLLIFHGRKVCIARRPLCEKCVLEPLCPSSLLKAENQVPVKVPKKGAGKRTRSAPGSADIPVGNERVSAKKRLGRN